MDYQEAHARPTMPKSLVGLFTDLFREVTGLMSEEIRLIRTEIGNKVSRASSGTVILSIGYHLATVGS